jgi:lipoate-protein ligase A
MGCILHDVVRREIGGGGVSDETHNFSLVIIYARDKRNWGDAYLLYYSRPRYNYSVETGYLH